MSDSERPRDLPALLPGDSGRHIPERRGSDVLPFDLIRSGAGEGEPHGTHFWDYWRVLRRRRWIVLTCLLAGVMIAMILTAATPPVYRATATLRIEKDQPRILKFEQVVHETASQQDDYQTHYKILRTRVLASRVIKDQSLDQLPEFQGGDRARIPPVLAALISAGEERVSPILTSVGEWLSPILVSMEERLLQLLPAEARSGVAQSRGETPPPPVDSHVKQAAVVNAYLDRLSVDPVRNSRLVALSFDSRDPNLAARVANAASEAFIAYQLDQKMQATRYATSFLAQELDKARDRLADAESRLNQFLDQNNIIFLNAEKTGQPPDLITQQLTVLSDALLKARGERIAREGVVAQVETYDINSLPAVLSRPLVSQLKQELVTLEAEHKRLGQIFRGEYPRMQQLAEKIQETRRQLETEVSRTVNGLRAEYEAALKNERDFEAALMQQQSRARGLTARMAEYNLLRRNVDTGRELHGSLLSRLRETQISASLFTSNISITDRAEVPIVPSRPRKKLNLLVGLVIGLLTGLGLAFVVDYLDTSIKSTREAEKVLRVRTLGEIPFRAVGGRATRWSHALSSGRRRRAFALASYAHAASPLAEVFRSLRTTILYSAPESPPRVMMVTSIHPGEGKTSLATNLAVTLAELDAGPVLLIDADFRRPELHKILGIARAPGFADILCGRARLELAVTSTTVPNLCAIPGGSGLSAHEPAELFATARLQQALSTLGERFRYIILDTPPLLGLSDALILASQVDGVVLTIREGRASRDAAYRAIKSLASVRGRLLGVVLNDVRGASDYYEYSGRSRQRQRGRRPKTELPRGRPTSRESP